MTIIKYTTAPVDGPESDVEYDTYDEGAGVAERGGLQLIARHYVFSDSELVADFTRYHWLLTARVDGGGGIVDADGDDLYRPDGLDSCHDSPDEAVDNLVQRFTLSLRELDGCDTDPADGKAHCGTCDPCRGYDSMDAAVRGLWELDADTVEESGYVCTVAADPNQPVVYRITRILFSNCDGENHR